LSYVKGSEYTLAKKLSTLPCEQSVNSKKGILDYINFFEGMVPIGCDVVRVETKKDIVLSKVYKYIEQGWFNETEEELKLFY